MSIKEIKTDDPTYSVPETVYVTKTQQKTITKMMKTLGFPSRSALLRRAIGEGLKHLDRYLPPDQI